MVSNGSMDMGSTPLLYLYFFFFVFSFFFVVSISTRKPLRLCLTVAAIKPKNITAQIAAVTGIPIISRAQVGQRIGRLRRYRT